MKNYCCFQVGTVEQLEQKILEQEGEIANMENRNYYSLYCLQMETQLIHANLDILYDILAAMASVQSKSHSAVSIHLILTQVEAHFYTYAADKVANIAAKGEIA